MINYTRLRPFFFGIIIAAILTFGILQNSGFFFEADLKAYREHIVQINIEADESIVMQHFKRVHPQQRQFVIGVIAVEDHNPVFVGRPYRVYAVGYYDEDHQPRRLIHIVCQNGKVQHKSARGRVKV